MKLAKSLFYGGQLINAADVDYEDYKRLGLLCPECNEAVYLQRESVRLIGNKSTLISSHFKHFEVKDPALAKRCQHRVDSYTQEEIEKAASKARNQRLRLFQQHFWNTFTGFYKPEDFDIPNLVNHAKQVYFVEEIALDFLMQESIEQIKSPYRRDVVRQMMDHVISSKGFMLLSINENYANQVFNPKNLPKKGFPGVIPCQALQSKFIDEMRTKLDVKIQELIVNEVLDFLITKSAYPILQNLIRLGSYLILDALLDDSKFGFLGWDGNEIVYPFKYENIEAAAQVNFEFWDIPKNRLFFHFYCLGHVYLLVTIFPWSVLMQQIGKERTHAN